MIYSRIPASGDAVNLPFSIDLASKLYSWAIVDPNQSNLVDGALYLVEGRGRPAALARCRSGKLIPAHSEGAPGGRAIFGGERRPTGRVISYGGVRGL